MQSVTITTDVMSSNPTHGKVYLIQIDVIKFVSDLWQVGRFLRVLRYPPNKAECHDIAEILLKVTLTPKWNQTTNVCWDGPWVIIFQNCISEPKPPFKMAVVTKNRNFFYCLLLLYYKLRIKR